MTEPVVPPIPVVEPFVATEFPSTVERGIPSAVAKYNRRVSATIATMLLITLASLALSGLLVYRSYHRAPILAGISQAARKTDCFTRLQSDFDGAVGRAFLAPPAPNPERVLAAKDIQRSAERLRDSDKVCAHGTPPPLAPSSGAQP